METHGDRIIKSVGRATSTVILVAPFIKHFALQRILEAAGRGVAISCYTRWRPEEIAAGVSDIEVWPLLRDRHGSLRLRYDLHAKVYCADDECLVGSANLTSAGLGWANAPSLEVLVPTHIRHDALIAFFDHLKRGTTEVNDTLYAEMRDVVTNLPVTVRNHLLSGYNDEGKTVSLASWLPRCRIPGNHNLYRTYVKQWQMVNRTTYEDALNDLTVLNIPEGIESEFTFFKYVAAVLRQNPVVAFVAERAKDPILPSAGQQLITGQLGYGNGPNGEITGEEWTTLRTWISTFLGDEFRQRQGDSGPELVRSVRIA